jgi:prepilin-type processing-associated H-X9-DG protein
LSIILKLRRHFNDNKRNRGVSAKAFATIRSGDPTKLGNLIAIRGLPERGMQRSFTSRSTEWPMSRLALAIALIAALLTWFSPPITGPSPVNHVDDFWSRHAQGVNFLTGDGSVRNLNDSITPSVWWALGTWSLLDVFPSRVRPFFPDLCREA